MQRIPVRSVCAPLFALALCAALTPVAHALDPHKLLTQYSRSFWSQENGLPQDNVRAIAQTADGFLWAGTDEGLARFDGYEFAIFNKASGSLPTNSVNSLAAGADGSLWIGTSDGLTRYKDGKFHTFTQDDGVPPESISDLCIDSSQALWMVAGVDLLRYKDGKFTTFAPGPELPITSARVLFEDRRGSLWVAGLTGIVKASANGKFTVAAPVSALEGNLAMAMVVDRRDHLWVGGSDGLLEMDPSGQIRRYGVREGLPDPFIRALKEDSDGNLWVGTNTGFARFESGRFTRIAPDSRLEMARAIFEDREGNVWIGGNGLIELRDDMFTVFGKPEGLPSDEPNAIFQDRAGRIWVGYPDSGLMQFSPQRHVYTAGDGLPQDEVLAIHDTRSGDLLLSTRSGLVIYGNGRHVLYEPRDSLARMAVFHAIEDSRGRIWMGSWAGLDVIENGVQRNVVPGGPLMATSVVDIYEGRDGAIWAGTYGEGLWRIQGEKKRLYTMKDGLSSDKIRRIYEDGEGTVWIGTSGGGLTALRNGRFLRFTSNDGLLSDNIDTIEDDGESLWLGTTRGICRISKAQLNDFAAHKRTSLQPVNYGLTDGLRSAQCAPAAPVGGGGVRTVDGRLWFTTNRGLAVTDLRTRQRRAPAPLAYISAVTADGNPIAMDGPGQLQAGAERIQIRYNAIHLSGPDRVQYSYKLEGLNRDWVQAGTRRLANYNTLSPGVYRFLVRAALPEGPESQAVYTFELLPRYFETVWFRLLCVLGVILAGWGGYQLRLRQIRSRFSLVLDERARLAREIHDTLAQGFVGISSQLDAVAMLMPEKGTPARKCLDMARRMVRHSLTEARRSVMDLRSSVLEGQDLGTALESGARMWTAGSSVEVDVTVTGRPKAPLPQDTEQHLLRIAQEAVANSMKHSGATRIWIKLGIEGKQVSLRIKDDGCGFDPGGAFSAPDGHFGVIGMRERAERIRGEMRLTSHPGEGAEVEVIAPLT